jgi:putative glutamine amidotransferase
MARPLILITTWRRALPTFLGDHTVLETLDPAYADRVADAGGQPLLLTRSAVREPGDLATVLARADGLVLTGGGDVDPATYGAEPENVSDEDAVADRFELEVIAAARAAGLPTLAICRGAQLLAIAHGGRLAQRLRPDGRHAELAGRSPGQILAERHPARLVPGSRVAAALGDAGEVAVNTIHHHVIEDPGTLAVTATAPDGVIEAVEPADGWACVGVQWHPEKMHEPAQRGLFAALIDAVEARAGADARPRRLRGRAAA